MESKILIVEDNPDDEELTVRALQRSNLVNHIVVVRDGAEALDYLFATGAYSKRDPLDVPHVVLLDIKLPKISGIEVLRRIRLDKRTTLLPVVILTSSDEENDIVDSYELRANSYVRKPVEFNQFAEAVQKLGLYLLVLNLPASANRDSVTVRVNSNASRTATG
jgi:two-component system response regulator